MAKTISILIPTLNEEENVYPIYNAVKKEFKKKLPKYNYEIFFIDNYSTDSTRKKISDICAKDKKVKAIFNARNFGPVRSVFYGLLQTSGGCAVLMCADFQDPVDMLPKFVKEWEKGHKIVIGIKKRSEESRLMFFLRSQYYKFIQKFSDTEQIRHFTGYGLYDRSFIKLVGGLEDPFPYFRGMVSELGYKIKKIEYVQPKRRAGKTTVNWYRLYKAGMQGITAYTDIGLRAATLLGFALGIVFLLVGIVYFVYKLLFWSSFPLGLAPVVIGIYLLGAVQLFFIGIVGEYILNINARLMKRPLVVEEKRINCKRRKKK